MYSDSSSHDGWSRCLFCSLQCALGIRDAGGGRLEATFPLDGGLCSRGQCVGELAMIVRRGTAWDSREGRQLTADEGIRAAGERLGERIDIVVDGNHRGEVLALVAALVAGNEDHIRGFVSLPGEDLLLLEHAWSSGARTGGLESLERADGLVVVGDPFSSHPRSAQPILDFKARNRRAPFVVIDCTARRTALFATHQVIVDPPSVPAAVAGLIPKDAAAFPRQSPTEIDPSGVLERAMDALTRCERLAVIIASGPGRGPQWPAAAYYGGLLARLQGSPLGVLTQYGNARSAARFVAAGALRPVGLLPQTPSDGRSVVVVGEEALCLPTGETAEYVSRASTVVHIGVTPMRAAEALEFKGVGFFEDAGSVLTGRETWEFVPPAIAPPAGVLQTTLLLRRIMEGAGYRLGDEPLRLPEHPEFVAPPASPALAPMEGSGDLRGLLAADPEQFVDGQLTGLTSLLGAQVPTVLLSPADCGRRGITDGARVTVSSESGECAAVAKMASDQPAGSAVVSCTNGEVKGLFAWDMCHGLPIYRPTRVTVALRNAS